MKWLFLAVSLLPAVLMGSAQDTLYLVRQYDGSKSFWLVTKADTTLVTLYPDGKKETERTMKSNHVTGTYKRWYQNGKIMWEKEIVDNVSNGKTVFYDEKGKKAAELNYERGIINDTIFIKENIHLVLGKVTSESTVYGGMQREDGSSNVSRSSGPWMYYSMYAAKVDSLQPPVLVQNYRTDHNGEFFILAPEGKIGFFPANIAIDKLKPGEFYPPQTASMSGHAGWNMTEPLEVLKSDKILFINLHHFSVGYAP